MAEQQPTDTQPIIQAPEKPFAELLEVYRQLESAQNTIANRQGLIKKTFEKELAPIREELEDIGSRIGYIERLAHEYDWARRREEGSNA